MKICPECGNDEVAEGLPVCTDCMEQLWPTSDPPDGYYP